MASEVALNAGTINHYNQSSQQQSNKLSQDFDDLLILLTTQLQNQDPLSPMESTEFTNQLVQFSQVEQQINMNQKLNQMLSLQLAGTSNVALGYVGLDVSYIGDLFYHPGEGKTHELHYALPEKALGGTTIYIRDAETGDVVRTVKGEMDAGNHTFKWDGLDDDGVALPVGNYRFTVDALNEAEEIIEGVSTAVSGRVTGIESVNGIIQLLLQGDGIVPVSSIINAKQPPIEQVADSGDTDNDDTVGETDDGTEPEEVTDEETT